MITKESKNIEIDRVTALSIVRSSSSPRSPIPVAAIIVGIAFQSNRSLPVTMSLMNSCPTLFCLVHTQTVEWRRPSPTSDYMINGHFIINRRIEAQIETVNKNPIFNQKKKRYKKRLPSSLTSGDWRIIVDKRTALAFVILHFLGNSFMYSFCSFSIHTMRAMHSDMLYACIAKPRFTRYPRLWHVIEWTMIQIAANEMAEEEEEKRGKNDNQPNRYPMTNREHVSTDYFITFMFTSTHRIRASSRFFFVTVCALTSRQNAKRFFVQFQLHAAPMHGALRLFVYVNSTKWKLSYICC